MPFSNNIKKYLHILALCFPSIIAIFVSQIISIEVFHNGPILPGKWSHVEWEILQIISAFVFAYISDRRFRKATLIGLQIFGAISGIILSIYGFEIWVIGLLAIAFNPLPVARAALLDNFPHFSALKLMAITFLAQFMPWAFYGYIVSFPLQPVLYLSLVLLVVNTFLTIFFFKDNVDKMVNHKSEISIVFFEKKIIPTLCAFVLAEVTFTTVWAYLAHDETHRAGYFGYTTFGTLIGIASSMLYTRLPHMSIITLFYSIGAAITFVSLSNCFMTSPLCTEDLLDSMSHYAIVGGLYMPFVTDAIIRMVGKARRAFGAALIEFGQSIAALTGALVNFIFLHNTTIIFVSIVLFYILATVIQRNNEKKLLY